MGSSKIIAVTSSRVVTETVAADWLLDYAAAHASAADHHAHWEDVCGMAAAMATTEAQTQRLASIKEQRRSGAAVENVSPVAEAALVATAAAEDEETSRELKRARREEKKRKKEEKKAKKEAKRAKKEAKRAKKEAKQEE